MIQRLWNRCKKFFLPDIIFFGVVLLFLLLGLALFLLSHLPVSAGLGLRSTQSLLLLDIPLPSLPSNAVFTLHKDAVQWLNQPKSIFDFTDPGATYNNPTVKQFWLIFLFIADLMIGIFIVLAGYQVIFAGLSSRYSEALEALPNLLFAAIGANISLIFARFWVDLNNLLCTVMIAQVDGHSLLGFGAFLAGLAFSTITIPIIVILLILVILLGVQMAARLGIIILLTVFLPILFAMLAHYQTRRFGQSGLSSYVTAVLLQFLQLACILLGATVLLPFVSANIGPADGIASVATILAGIALLWITLRIPSLLRQWALQPVADSSRAASSLAVAIAARLIHR